MNAPALNPVTVVLADDEQLLRAALAALLPLDGTLDVVGEAHDGETALEAVRHHQPDVLVIDLEMPGTDGLHALRGLQQEESSTAVLMLTRHARPGVLRRALGLGVRGFMSKSADPEQIAEVVRHLAGGGRWIAHEVLEASMIDDCPLTERELDVLREAREGYAVTAIAETLHLAPGTVRNYLSAAMTKIGARTRHDAARHAHQRGWL